MPAKATIWATVKKSAASQPCHYSVAPFLTAFSEGGWWRENSGSGAKSFWAGYFDVISAKFVPRPHPAGHEVPRAVGTCLDVRGVTISCNSRRRTICSNVEAAPESEPGDSRSAA